MSASTNRASGLTFSRLPEDRLSTTVTSSPRSSRASTRFEPMKPAPPVTRARMRRGMLVAASAAGTVARVTGLFVTFEGIDRSGKTTQARMLCDALGSRCVSVRDPGGTELGERMRALLKDPAVSLSAHAEALLFSAARVHDAYERMADAEPRRWRRVPADRPPEVVHGEVLRVVEAALARVPA